MNFNKRMLMGGFAENRRRRVLVAGTVLLLLAACGQYPRMVAGDRQQERSPEAPSQTQPKTPRQGKPASADRGDRSETPTQGHTKKKSTMLSGYDQLYDRLKREYLAHKAADQKHATGLVTGNRKVGSAEELLKLARQLVEKSREFSASDGSRSLWLRIRLCELLEDVAEAGCERQLLEDLLRRAVTEQQKATSELSACLAGLAVLILAKNDPKTTEIMPNSRVGIRSQEDPAWRFVWAVGSEASIEYDHDQFCRANRIDPTMCRDRVFALALLAIDSYADRQARDFLLQFAWRDDLDDRTKARIWQLLLHYDGARCLVPQFEKAFRQPVKAVASREFGYEFSGLNVSPLSLSSWVRELDYIKSLDAAARDRYIQIRRLIFLADASMDRRSRKAPVADPHVWVIYWQEGDERFLPHLIGLRPYFRYAITKAPLSEGGLAWLKQQAESGPWSDDVKTAIREALDEREKRQQPLERQAKQSPQ